jgi:PAS domain S-box-containing protein
MRQSTELRLGQRAMQDMREGVLILDQDGAVLFANRSARDLLELEGDPQRGAAALSLLPEDAYNDPFREMILKAVERKEQTHVEQVRYRGPSGRESVFRMSSAGLEEEGRLKIVITLADETEQEELRGRMQESAHLFTTFLFAFCIWMILYALWEYLGRPIPADDMTRGVEIMGVILFALIFHYKHLTWRDLGLAPDRPARTIRTGILIAAGALGLLAVLKVLIRAFRPDAFGPGESFIDFGKFGARQIRYIFTAGIQEFLARSVMQGNLKRIMASRRPALAAILLSSLIFAALHIHLGLMFMLGAAILAGLEGILYEKQQSVYGVWIVHWVFGVGGTLLSMISH